MSRNKPVILFDMDGVLVNSEPVITAAAIAALSEFGVRAKQEDFRPFTGMGEIRFLGGVSEKYGVPYQDEMKKRTYEIYQTMVAGHLEVYPGTLPTIRYLREKSVPFGLASSADKIKVIVNLRQAGIDPDWFGSIVWAEHVEKRKPDPDIYLMVARQMGARTEDCIVLEDALSGIEAARRANMKCLALPTSFSKERLLAAGAAEVLEDIGCLPRWLGAHFKL